MTQRTNPPKPIYPCHYKGYLVTRIKGRFYGVPGFLDLDEVCRYGWLNTHRAILSASTREEVDALIDGTDANRWRAQLLGRFEGYNLVRHGDSVYGVPQTAARLDLGLEEESRRAGVIQGVDCEEVKDRIRAAAAGVPVEFAGWLPIYEMSGNCGRHPQFQHTGAPPAGYRFTCAAPPSRPPLWKKKVGRFFAKVGKRLLQVLLVLWMLIRPLTGVFRGRAGLAPRARLRVFGAMIRMFFSLLWNGGRLVPVLRFLRTRHYQSQVLLGNYRGLVFLTSMPYTYGQNPWVIEIEDPTTLFYPMIQNGQTSTLQIARSPYFPIVKTVLESAQCKAVLTHMKSTAALVATLFGSATIRDKIIYAPLGARLPERWQRHQESEHINLVFINSWCQVPENFYVRGGLDLLEAFAILHERYPQLRLTIRTNLPPLDVYYHRILEAGWVRVIHRFQSAAEMDALLAESHIFLLPAARVHIVSMLQAMSYGLAVVTSDGWGIEEYIEHDRNGLIVKGRYGKTSWADEQAGMLREDYQATYTPDPEVVQGIVEAVSRLVEEPGLRQRLGRAARQDVQTTFTLERWNQGLKEALDRASATGGPPKHFDFSQQQWIGGRHVPGSHPYAHRSDAT
jgi:hypothetical protein